MSQEEIVSFHHKAMELAEQASTTPDPLRARKLFQAALKDERKAAELWESGSNLEPTRSVLYRSAASLAVDCQDYAEARRLISKGLSGEPPDDIRQELLDLLTRIEPPERTERRLSSGKR